MARAFGYSARGEGSDTLELDIYDIVGRDWWGDGVSAQSFRRTLKQSANAKLIKLRINSEGGDVFDGFAIYNLLCEHTARVEVDIDALAASIASVIAMAADEIRIASNAFVMIHNPWGGVRGESHELRRWADVLDKMRDQAGEIYAARSGQTAAKCIEMMAAETWMTAAEAKALGFVDKVMPLKKAKASASASARAFASVCLDDFENVPAGLRAAVEAARAERERQPALFRSNPEPEGAEDANHQTPNLGQETDTMNKKLLAQLLGIAESATDEVFEAAIAAAVQERNGSKALLVKLESVAGKGGDELHGIVLAWKADAAELVASRAELVKLKADAGKNELEQLILAAKAGQKLSPAEETTLRAQVADGELTLKGAKALLETKAAHPALKGGKAPGSSGAAAAASDTGELKHGGKTYAELKPAQRAALKRENEDLYTAMRDAHEASAS